MKFSTIIHWIQKNRLEFVIIVLILLVTLGMRLYKIDQYMTFLGDEGRDAIIIKKMLTQGQIPLLGPPTSVGNMYDGPLYYYMMAVAMGIWWLNPIAAAVMVALIGTATVGLIYFFARNWFGKIAAVLAAVLYSVSPVNITYSRSSWNPNPAPFFGLLLLMGFYQVRRTKNMLWFILVGSAWAFAIQMHFLALILLGLIAILWGYEVYLFLIKKQKYMHFWSGTIGGVFAFCLLMSPWVLFDIRHNWMNLRALMTFFTDRQSTVNVNPINSLTRVPPIYQNNLISRYMAGQDQTMVWVLSILLLLPILWGVYVLIKKRIVDWPKLAVGLWMIIGLLGLSLYKQSIFDHYLSFMNPSAYLLFGALFSLLVVVKNVQTRRIIEGILVLFSLILILFNLLNSPLKQVPNNQLHRTQDVAKFIIQKSEGKPFNFALLSEHNYDAAYQFYLDMYQDPPKQLPFDKTDQLFVVCEDPVCAPVGNAKYEIAAFGWTKIDYEIDRDGVKIYRLVHNPEEPK